MYLITQIIIDICMLYKYKNTHMTYFYINAMILGLGNKSKDFFWKLPSRIVAHSDYSIYYS